MFGARADTSNGAVATDDERAVHVIESSRAVEDQRRVRMTHRLAGAAEKFNRSKEQFDDLIGEMDAFFNADPKPYAWRAEGAEILAKIKRARAALDNAQAVM